MSIYFYLAYNLSVPICVVKNAQFPPLFSVLCFCIVFVIFFLQVVLLHSPDVLAIHCQEMGGKDFDAAMLKVNKFIQ